MKRANDSFAQGFDAVLLLVADLGLVLDNVPELENAVLDLLDVGWWCDSVTTGHLLDVGLKLVTKGESLVVDELGILLRNVKGFGDEVGHAFADETVRVEVCRIGFLRQI